MQLSKVYPLTKGVEKNQLNDGKVVRGIFLQVGMVVGHLQTEEEEKGQARIEIAMEARVLTRYGLKLEAKARNQHLRQWTQTSRTGAHVKVHSLPKGLNDHAPSG